MVGQHGEKAIDVVVDNSKPRFHSAFASNHSSHTVQTKFDEVDSNPSVVVFYQISFEPGKSDTALLAIRAQFDAFAMGRYNNVTDSFEKSRKVLLYYTISGGSAEEVGFVTNLCQEHHERITCQQVGRYDTNRINGGSLQLLHSFCNARPSFDVIYIRNQLQAKYDPIKIKEVTSGIISKMCVPSKESCNVCGMEFYPLPFLHFTNNMFSASCDYVKQLLPPAIFEERMNDIAGDALVSKIEETYTTKLVQFDERILGSYQYSTEHWIGSHPDLRPCDVAPIVDGGENNKKMKTPDTLDNNMKHYSQSPGPRRGSAPPGYFKEEIESKFRKRREVALREYYYLAGNVFRWNRLYDRVPPQNSWAWRWFPDGKIWEAAARSGGAYAVNHIADQIEPVVD